MGNFSWYTYLKESAGDIWSLTASASHGCAKKGQRQTHASLLSLWYRACSSPSPEMSRRLIHKQAQGAQQRGLPTESNRVVGTRCRNTTTYRKTCCSHTWVSRWTPCHFHFSWTSFMKSTATAHSPAPSPTYTSTWVQYLHKPYKLLPGLWTFNVLMKTKKM